MPWSETDVLEWARRSNEGEGEVNVSELCREFGVSLHKRWGAAEVSMLSVDQG